jgi:hypothetical protein
MAPYPRRCTLAACRPRLSASSGGNMLISDHESSTMIICIAPYTPEVQEVQEVRAISTCTVFLWPVLRWSFGRLIGEHVAPRPAQSAGYPWVAVGLRGFETPGFRYPQGG